MSLALQMGSLFAEPSGKPVWVGVFKPELFLKEGST